MIIDLFYYIPDNLLIYALKYPVYLVLFFFFKIIMTRDGAWVK